MMKNKESNVNVLKYIWQMLMYRPWFYLLNCILWITIHVFPLVPGLLTKKIFDNLELTGRMNSGIELLMAALIIMAVSRTIIILLGGFVDSNHRFSMSALLRRNMLEAIMNDPCLENKTSLGETMNCFRDDASEIEDIISFTLDILGDGFFAVGAFVIMMSISVKLTVVIVIPLLIVMVLSKRAMKNIRKYRISARNSTSAVSGAIGEIFSGIQAVKLSGNEEYILNNLRKLNNKRMKAMVLDKIFVTAMDSIFLTASAIGTGMILLLSRKYMIDGTFSLGDFTLFIYYLPYVSDFAGFLGEIIARYKHGGVAFERMNKLLSDNSGKTILRHNSLHLKGKLEDESMPQETREFRKLKIKNLSCVYDNGKGINNVDLIIHRGEFIVVTGRIASGKTTLLKALLGLLPITGGTIYLNEELAGDRKKTFVPPVAAYTSQKPNLFSDTVKNNILLGMKEDEAVIDNAITASVLESDLDGFKEGLETVIGSKGVKLSGGQRQRVAVARMFARKAGLYIFDDISSALDVETEAKLWNRMNEDMTAIVVSNRHAALTRADKIVVMKDGHVEDNGTLDELMERCDEMRQIWGIEA